MCKMFSQIMSIKRCMLSKTPCRNRPAWYRQAYKTRPGASKCRSKEHTSLVFPSRKYSNRSVPDTPNQVSSARLARLADFHPVLSQTPRRLGRACCSLRITSSIAPRNTRLKAPLRGSQPGNQIHRGSSDHSRDCRTQNGDSAEG